MSLKNMNMSFIIIIDKEMDSQHVVACLERFIPAKNILYFLSILNKCGAHIVGSNIPQMLTGRLYDNSDLDIYCPVTHHRVLKLFFQYCGYQKKKKVAYKIGQGVSYSKIPGEITCTNLFKDKLKVQLLSLYKHGREFNVHEYVASFDLTCCMGYFDGQIMTSYFYDYLACSVSKMLFNNDSRRLEKYKARGFQIESVREEDISALWNNNKIVQFKFDPTNKVDALIEEFELVL